MKRIKILFAVNLVFLGCTVFGQRKDTTVSDSLKRHYYNVVFSKISPNDRYVVFNKSYGRTSDTIVVLDRKKSEQIIFESGGVFAYSVGFTNKNNLFFRQGTDANLLKIPSLDIHKWKGVSDAFYDSNLKQAFLLQNNTLKILDEEGKEIKSVPNVISIKGQSNLLYYVVKEDNVYQLTQWNGNFSKILYTSKNENLEIQYRDEHGLFILEKDQKTRKGELTFKGENDGVFFPFNKWCTDALNSVNISKIDDHRYFVHIYSDSLPIDKSSVDIWYGNDPKIQTKFFGDSIGKFFIWDPSGNEFCPIINSDLSHHTNIGNSRYLLSFDPYFKHDYTKKFKTFNLHRYDTVLKKYDFVANSGSIVFTDTHGKYILTYKKGEGWDLYNIESFIHQKISVPEYEGAYFSTDGQTILFEGTGKLYHYKIKTKKLETISFKDGFRVKIKNGSLVGLAAEFNIFQQTYPADESIIVELYDQENIRSAWYTYDGKSSREVIPCTSKNISSVSWDVTNKTFLYIKSSLNVPPQLIISKGNKQVFIYQSNKNDLEAKNIKSEVISYKNSRGVRLKGVLLYPLQYDKAKRYPMVVTIYQKLRYNMNKYLIDGIGMNGPTEGINIRTLLRKGYMVYLPDIVFDDRGTGRSALDCVNNAMDALLDKSSIDFTKVALIGHSHGGYETNFIATQSSRFATYISGAGNSDLVRSYHSFNYEFKRPFYWQYEDGQYEMPGSFTANKALYADNSPVYHAEKVTEPILLWTGMEDYNIFWEQTMEFYLGLRRNHKHVTALFYPKEGHSLSKVQNRIDLYSRIYEWLDFHLKNKKQHWIEKMYK